MRKEKDTGFFLFCFFFLLRFSSRSSLHSISTADEVALIQSVARSSGVLLDGSYTGKAMFGFCRDAKEFEGKKCLFVHTGGAFSLFGMPKDLIVQRSLITNN